MKTKTCVVATLALSLLAAAAASACSHSDDHGGAKTASAVSVAGPQDTHCGTNVVTVDPGVCKQAPAEAGAGDGGTGDVVMAAYGATLAGLEGDDDDCKYHLKWSTPDTTTTTTTKSLSLRPLHGESASTGAAGGADATFTVTITHKKDGTPVTGAPVEIEAFLDETHPSLNADQTAKELSPGTYAVGPVRFDVSGKWTVRFHIHDECNDSEESPHGHGAFFAQVTVP